MSTKMPLGKRLFKWFLVLSALCVVGVGAAMIGVYVYVYPKLPSVESLKEVQFQVPLRIYTEDEQLIAEYGEKRREPVNISAVPAILSNAFVSAEDDRFYQHPGVDYQGILRAALHLVRTGKKGQGGSTITMQVARNFFLTNEKTYSRKLTEILLALRIESELNKDKILELYLNKIYLGNRAYGVGAAAKVYYGKDVASLSLAEAAMIAGLPKAPSRYNPIVNPERALLRRNYVLRRMRELNYINSETFTATVKQPVTAKLHYSKSEVEADYVAEMVRSKLKQLYPDTVYSAGYRVFTTLRGRNQLAANKALRKALVAYERRHGYIGPVDKIEDAELLTELLLDGEALQKKLSTYSEYGDLRIAVATDVGDEQVLIRLKDGSERIMSWTTIEWARARIGKDKLGDKLTKPADVISQGDIFYVELGADETALMAQMPSVESALISIHPSTGEILALVGGFDFQRSKFNRVMQAHRQPGSNFKPFIYSAALQNGDTAASIYNDAPVVFHDSALEGEWRPENYSGRFFGPTRLREALVKSRNLVSIRLLKGLGFRKSFKHIARFGFDTNSLPRDLSLALGSGSVTPMQLVRGYSVFANQGYLVKPYFIDRIEDVYGEVLFQAPTVVLCDAECMLQQSEQYADSGVADSASEVVTNINVGSAAQGFDPVNGLAPVADSVTYVPLVIDPRNAYIMNSILREVVRRGTATRAKVLKRKDLAGKTGTSNDQHDAWFSGFNSQVATSVWVGFDELQPLGAREAGGRAALPVWIDYMREIIVDMPSKKIVQPLDMTTVRIDKKTGEKVSGRNGNSMFEMFRAEYAPGVESTILSKVVGKSRQETGSVEVRLPPVRKTKSHKKKKKAAVPLF